MEIPSDSDDEDEGCGPKEEQQRDGGSELVERAVDIVFADAVTEAPEKEEVETELVLLSGGVQGECKGTQTTRESSTFSPPPPCSSSSSSSFSSHSSSSFSSHSSSSFSSSSSHSSPSSSLSLSLSLPVLISDLKIAATALCRFFSRKGGCRDGEACRFLHINVRPSNHCPPICRPSIFAGASVLIHDGPTLCACLLAQSDSSGRNSPDRKRQIVGTSPGRMTTTHAQKTQRKKKPSLLMRRSALLAPPLLNRVCGSSPPWLCVPRENEEGEKFPKTGGLVGVLCYSFSARRLARPTVQPCSVSGTSSAATFCRGWRRTHQHRNEHCCVKYLPTAH